MESNSCIRGNYYHINKSSLLLHLYSFATNSQIMMAKITEKSYSNIV